MFEDSLVESRVGHVFASTRWTALASVTLQCALAGLVIALPLLHPEALSFHVDAPRVLMPLPPKPPVQIVRVQPATTASSIALPTATQTTLLPMLPHPMIDTGDAPPVNPLRFGADMSPAIPNMLGTGAERSSRVSVTPVRPTGPVQVSSGVLEGMLLTPIHPLYPAIAKAAGVQGTVVVEAIISRAGTVESVRVVSGPPMLQAAAVEAIRAARYRPYRLDGQPTDVQTTFTVNFRMGG
jgi:protein TonB